MKIVLKQPKLWGQTLLHLLLSSFVEVLVLTGLSTNNATKPKVTSSSLGQDSKSFWEKTLVN